jgi:hypothetical protein
MHHACSDHYRLQDPTGLIPDDEPVFLLRGHNRHLPAVLAFYQELVGRDSEVAPDLVRMVGVQRARVIRWQHAHGRKSPTLPEPE